MQTEYCNFQFWTRMWNQFVLLTLLVYLMTFGSEVFLSTELWRDVITGVYLVETKIYLGKNKLMHLFSGNVFVAFYLQKQPSIGVLRKSCCKFTGEHLCRSVISMKFFSEQLYWNHTSTWVFSCKFAAHFQNTFL